MDYLGDLIGEILEDEIGARAGRARRLARRAGRRANRAARRAGRSGASATPRTVGNKLLAGDQRADILGLGSATIPGSNGIGQLQTVVQKPIQISRLILSGESGWEAIQILDIKIGVDSQFTSTDGAPAAMFGPTAVGAGVQFRPAQTGVTVTITLRNPTANPLTISGSALGISAQ